MISLFFYVKKFQKYEQQKTHEKDIFTARLPPARERERERGRERVTLPRIKQRSLLSALTRFSSRERERERDILARDLSLSYISFFDRTCEKKV